MDTTTTKTRIFFDMHLPEWNESDVARRFDVDDLSSALIASDADSVILYAKCQYGNAYYDTKIGHKHAGLGSLDLLRETTKRLHAAGKEVIAYYSVAWDEFQAALHPEWLTLDREGEFDSQQFRWKTLCVNSPYRSFVLSQLQEIAEETSVDGFWIDMTIIGDGKCYCNHCRKKYETLHPDGQDLGDLTLDDSMFLDFRFDYIEEFFRDAYAVLRKVDPKLQILNNYWGYPYSPLSMGSRAIGAQTEADMVTGEAYADWTGLQSPEFFSRFLRGVANGRPYEALIGRFVNTWDFTRKPYDQLFFECMTVFSHGGMVTLDDEPYYDGTIDGQLYHEDLRTIFQTIHKHASCLEGERLCYGAIYHSQYTKTMQKQTDFIKDVVGAYKLLRDAHFPVDFLFDENATSEMLARYPVVFLPSVSHLDPHAIGELEAYLLQGGLVVSFGLNALMDSSVVNGILSDGQSTYSLSYIRSGDEANPAYLLVRGAYQQYRLDGKQASCETEMMHSPALVDPIVENDAKTFYHNNLPSPYKDSLYPLAIKIRYDKGMMIHFNQPIARSYAKQPSKGLRELVLQTIHTERDWPVVQLDAPMRVASEVYDDRSKGKMHVHLMVAGSESSLSCGILDTMQGNFERPFVYMEQRDRVSGISMELTLANRVKTITSIYEENQLFWKQEGNSVSIKIDGVSLWDIIEVVYEECETA
ncbi:alpha-amylase family protein [Pleomorphochaeta sp. DL1XJH-081]|uniref:alpha-amylase family protein n=1 Tax=Pleomorphochaeta sp. DL1XJH-081 TaxID=3409690 RepID=UPI003BB52096